MNLPPIFNEVYFGNTVLAYSWVIGLIVLGILFQKVFSKILSGLLYRIIVQKDRGVTDDDFHKLLHRPLAFFVLLIIAYLATRHIEFPLEWDVAPKGEFGIRLVLSKIFALILITSITWIILRILDFGGLILKHKAEKTEGKQDDQIVAFAKELIKILIVIFAFFIVMGEVFSVNVGALVAGLGIGGIAIALAAKDSIENLLSSFIIFFDKPFLVGDFVRVGDISGIVEKVGFRSTRVRTLEKSYLTVPNTLMINAAVDNMTLRTFRRADIVVGLVYGTKIAQIKKITAAIQQELDDNERTNMDGRVNFTTFGASSLDITIAFYVDTMDYLVYLDVKQEINFKIMEIVEANGSDFAFPTQTIHLEKN